MSNVRTDPEPSNSIAMHFRFLGTLLLVFMANGCTATFSDPQIVESAGWHISKGYWDNVEHVWISGNELSIRIRPHNYGKKGEWEPFFISSVPDEGRYFVITVQIQKIENSLIPPDTGTKFNPFMTWLAFPNIKRERPIGYIRQTSGLCGNTFLYSKNNHIEKSLNYADAIPESDLLDLAGVPGERNNCFDLFYLGAPPSVDSEFVVEIKGLEKDEQPIIVPKIQYKKHSGTNFPINLVYPEQ